MKPVILDLFCGAGGMSLGFEMAGYSIGLGVEKDVAPCQTHSHNFGSRCYLGNTSDIPDPWAFIKKHDLERIDIPLGGSPCHGHSLARKAPGFTPCWSAKWGEADATISGTVLVA